MVVMKKSQIRINATRAAPYFLSEHTASKPWKRNDLRNECMSSTAQLDLRADETE